MEGMKGDATERHAGRIQRRHVWHAGARHAVAWQWRSNDMDLSMTTDNNIQYFFL